MPILTAHLTSGHTSAQKSALLEASTQAVIKSLNAPLSSVRILLQEYAADGAMSAGRTDTAQLIYIVYLIEGRGPELKAALIAGLSEAATASIGISPEDVRVIIQDVPKTDMGLAGGVSAAAAGR